MVSERQRSDPNLLEWPAQNAWPSSKGQRGGPCSGLTVGCYGRISEFTRQERPRTAKTATPTKLESCGFWFTSQKAHRNSARGGWSRSQTVDFGRSRIKRTCQGGAGWELATSLGFLMLLHLRQKTRPCGTIKHLQDDEYLSPETPRFQLDDARERLADRGFRKDGSISIASWGSRKVPANSPLRFEKTEHAMVPSRSCRRTLLRLCVVYAQLETAHNSAANRRRPSKPNRN